MYWLDMGWITGNWVPLLVALVLGYLIGWLLTGMSPARRARELETRTGDLEARQRKTDRELADARSDNTKAKANLTTALADLEEARNRARMLEEKVAALEEAAEEQAKVAAAGALPDVDTNRAAEAEADTSDEMDVLDASAQESVGEAESEVAEAAREDALAEAGEPAAGTAAMTRQAAPVALAPDQIAESFTVVARAPEAIEADNARQVALTEAYNHAAHLQAELHERDKVLSARQAELESVKAELLTANAARHELDNRLVRAREDVASELAVLASTMIKMKDDALARAEARITALNNELNKMRAEFEIAAAHSAPVRSAQAADLPVAEPPVATAAADVTLVADLLAGETGDESADAA